VCTAACTSDGGTCSGNGDCCSGSCSNQVCCPAGKVGLSNGTCVLPCSIFTQNCPGGCVCDGDTTLVTYCTTEVVVGSCPNFSDSDCPPGSFCKRRGICIQAC
jgi:hypothetical protein